MRLTTGKGAAPASCGTTGGATGMTPTCGASTIGSSIGSSSSGTTSAVCSRSRQLRRYSVPLRLTIYDRGWPSSRTTVAGIHT